MLYDRENRVGLFWLFIVRCPFFIFHLAVVDGRAVMSARFSVESGWCRFEVRGERQTGGSEG